MINIARLALDTWYIFYFWILLRHFYSSDSLNSFFPYKFRERMKVISGILLENANYSIS